MFSTRIVAFALALSGLSSGYLMAQDHPNIQGKLVDKCQSDISRFCKDVTPGEGRTMACLKSHDDKLSQDCKTEWSKMATQFKQTAKDFRTACKDDVQSFCSDAPGPKEMASCLDTHTSDLSASCKDFRKTHPMLGMMDRQDHDMGMSEHTERTEHEEKSTSHSG